MYFRIRVYRAIIYSTQPWQKEVLETILKISFC